MPGGRPRKIKTPAELKALCDAYFADCDAKGKPYQIESLGLACGLAGRSGLDDYLARPEYYPVVKSAKAKVASSYERVGLDAKNPAFAIFILKNLGYTDKQETTVNANLSGSVKLDGRFEIALVKPKTSASTPAEQPNSTKTK